MNGLIRMLSSAAAMSLDPVLCVGSTHRSLNGATELLPPAELLCLDPVMTGARDGMLEAPQQV